MGTCGNQVCPLPCSNTHGLKVVIPLQVEKPFQLDNALSKACTPAWVSCPKIPESHVFPLDTASAKQGAVLRLDTYALGVPGRCPLHLISCSSSSSFSESVMWSSLPGCTLQVPFWFVASSPMRSISPLWLEEGRKPWKGEGHALPTH